MSGSRRPPRDLSGLPRVGSRGSPAAAVGGDRGNWGSGERRWHAQLPTRSRSFRGRWPNRGRSVVSGPLPRALSPQTTQGSPRAPVCAPTPQPAGAASPGLASASSKYSQIRQHLPRARVELGEPAGAELGGPQREPGTLRKEQGPPTGPAAGAGHPHRSPGESRAPQEGAAHGWVRGRLGRRARLRGPDLWTKATQQAVVGGRGLGEVRLGTVTLSSQTTSQQRRSRIHTSVHHDTDKFPLFNCLIKKTLQRADVWMGPPPRSWPIAHGCSQLRTQPVWAPQVPPTHIARAGPLHHGTLGSRTAVVTHRLPWGQAGLHPNLTAHPQLLPRENSGPTVPA